MPIGTPFHSRTSALCVSQNWRTWSGYFVASSYDVMHDYEYHAIRNTAALIDISPLYKYEVRGKDALRLVNRVITRDAVKCAVGQALYGCLCEDDGAVIQDGTVFRLAEDYFRFVEMLANGGELNGVRLLSPAAVQLMSSNHLATNLLTGEFGIGPHVMRAGFGYGYDCAVVFDPPAANLPEGRGTFFWDGAAGTWFWVDPTNDIVFVGMIQRMFGAGMPNVEYESRAVVYQALVNPKK